MPYPIFLYTAVTLLCEKRPVAGSHIGGEAKVPAATAWRFEYLFVLAWCQLPLCAAALQAQHTQPEFNRIHVAAAFTHLAHLEMQRQGMQSAARRWGAQSFMSPSGVKRLRLNWPLVTFCLCALFK